MPKRDATRRDSAVRSRADGRRFDITIDAPADDCIGHVETLAEVWGGDFTREGASRGHLTLPVRAGVRRGLVEGPVSFQGSAPTRLRFDVESRHDRIQYAAFIFLLLGALGGGVGMVVPFVPRLLPLMPVAVIFAVGAWLFIVARLTNSGPEEFFGELAALGDASSDTQE